MDKPEDLPKWAWDEAKAATEMFGYNDGDERIVASVARAILKAKNDALEAAAKTIDVMREVEHDREWLVLGEAAQAIRNLKHEG